MYIDESFISVILFFMAISPTDEAMFRLQIFAELEALIDVSGGFLTHKELLNFQLNGERFPLIEVQGGIRNPRDFASTLSIVNDFHSEYRNTLDDNGILRYHFRSGDPEKSFNKKLRVAFESRTPIILFNKPAPNMYIPVIGAQIVGEDLADGIVFVASGGDLALAFEAKAIDKSYVMRLTMQRMHQPAFRAVVLKAYKQSCAICRLNHAELLDAAHITPDSDPNGLPEVPNGLALCKIHHAAYDKKFLGIDGDYKVHINEKLLQERDGPMLQHGLVEMNGSFLQLPSRKPDRPDGERLNLRFQEFIGQ
jgi:putative restriction endonuclease